MVQQCPGCKADDCHSRNLVMVVSECGHLLCRQCMDKSFGKKTTARCLTKGCDKTLKRGGYRVQEFDDPRIEKQNVIRARLAKVLRVPGGSTCGTRLSMPVDQVQIFILDEEDFPTLRAYNDYLEKWEDMVANLMLGVHIHETEQELKQMEREARAKKLAYHHVAPNLQINGPKMPAPSRIDAYLNHVRQPGVEGVAGGYLAIIGCSRALSDAYQDLFRL